MGMQLFTRGVKTLHMRDVQTAEDLLNKHCQNRDEIGSKQDEIGSLIQLGQKMYERQPSQDIEEKIGRGQKGCFKRLAGI